MIPLESPEALTYFCLSELAKGVQTHDHPWKLMTMAVSNAENKPRSMMVVLRDFGANKLYFFTDKRSQKVSDFKANPYASFCLFNNELAIQLQLNCEVTIHKKNDLCKKYWDKLPAHNKICYASPDNPGKPLPTPFQFNKKVPEQEIFENFNVIEAHISNFDILHLRKQGNLRVSGDFKNDKLNVSWTMP